ncbi:glycosyltransferase [Methylomonas sp. MED-D]|uniref:glycosyltransferase n=1 Tax=Methylomonas sp. MED-D TaxID=3418768 RepID=UPI003D05C97D
MKILFIHQNFPAQFLQIATHLANDTKNQVMAIRQAPNVEIANISTIAYTPSRSSNPDIHPLMSEWEAKILRAEATAKAADLLKSQGFQPDIVMVHPGWGEALLLRDIWPHAKYLGYLEYFYAATGQDFNFDPEFKTDDVEKLAKLRLKNTVNLHALHDIDAGISPTHWQRSTYPAWAQSKIDVIHEGIDTNYFSPDATRTLTIPNKGITLGGQDEIITFVARYLEPTRGFHVFMRALPELLKRRPDAHVIIIGSETGGYGPGPHGHDSWLAMLMREVGSHLDPNRVHILGRLAKADYRNVLQLSKVHVYLTYPFLLSWSLLEVMATGPIIVASDTAPVRELIQDGKNGLLFDFFDQEGLVNRVVEALSLPKRKANSLSKAARKTIVTQYDLEQCLHKWTTKIMASI